MGDCVITTNNRILVENTKKLPAIVCVQRSATKQVVTENDLFESNKKSFGNEVGEITNKVTAMFEIRERFPADSKEREVLDYRILCGQLYQQNSIDRIKGIICKSMPDSWYSWIVNKAEEDDDDETIKLKEFNRKILSDKKPYFMRYIYPTANKKFVDYIKANNEKSLMRFRLNIEELIALDNPNDEQRDFIDYYNLHLPLGMAPCTINRICYKVEELFDGRMNTNKNIDFDYSILKSGTPYTSKMFNSIKDIYEAYKRELKSFKYFSNVERLDHESVIVERYLLIDEFIKRCLTTCPNKKMLCDIIVDLCYSKSNTSKMFCWSICGDVIIGNLLERNNYKFKYPEMDASGDIEFRGMRFSMKEIEVERPVDIEESDSYDIE